MRSKILVHIFSPATVKTYDMWIPLDAPMEEASVMIGRAITSLSNGLYAFDDTPVLYSIDQKAFLETKGTIYDSGIGNSTNLILM